MSSIENKYAAKTVAPSADETSKAQSKSSSSTFKIVAVVAILVVLGLAGASYVLNPFDPKSQSAQPVIKTDQQEEPKFTDISKLGSEPTIAPIDVDEPVFFANSILPQFIAVRLPALHETLLGTTRRKIIFGVSVALFLSAVIAAIVVAVIYSRSAISLPADIETDPNGNPTKVEDDTSPYGQALKDFSDYNGIIIGAVVVFSLVIAVIVFATCYFKVGFVQTKSDPAALKPLENASWKHAFVYSTFVIIAVAALAASLLVYYLAPRFFWICVLSFFSISAPIGGPAVLAAILIAFFLALIVSVFIYAYIHLKREKEGSLFKHFHRGLKYIANSPEENRYLEFLLIVVCTLGTACALLASIASPENSLIIPIYASVGSVAIFLSFLLFCRSRVAKHWRKLTTYFRSCTTGGQWSKK
jgi:hypothetical protein